MSKTAYERIRPAFDGLRDACYRRAKDGVTARDTLRWRTRAA